MWLFIHMIKQQEVGHSKDFFNIHGSKGDQNVNKLMIFCGCWAQGVDQRQRIDDEIFLEHIIKQEFTKTRVTVHKISRNRQEPDSMKETAD